MAPRELTFITGNKNKLAEVKAILGDIVTLQSQSLDLVEIQGSIEAISSDKCRRAAEKVFSTPSAPRSWSLLRTLQVEGPVLVEDTCLCFNALQELPGPYMYVAIHVDGARGR